MNKKVCIGSPNLSQKVQQLHVTGQVSSVAYILPEAFHNFLLCLRVFFARLVERKKAGVKRCEEQVLKLEVQATDREENKQIALGTSKLNYLDPRISVAW